MIVPPLSSSPPRVARRPRGRAADTPAARAEEVDRRDGLYVFKACADEMNHLAGRRLLVGGRWVSHYLAHAVVAHNRWHPLGDRVSPIELLVLNDDLTENTRRLAEEGEIRLIANADEAGDIDVALLDLPDTRAVLTALHYQNERRAGIEAVVLVERPGAITGGAGLPVRYVRVAGLYGPSVRDHHPPLTDEHLQSLLKGQAPIIAAGSRMRPWLYGADAACGLLKSVTHGEPGTSYDLAQSTFWADDDHILRLAVVAAGDVINRTQDKPVEEEVAVPNSRDFSAMQLVGFDPRVTPGEGLRRLLLWHARDL